LSSEKLCEGMQLHEKKVFHNERSRQMDECNRLRGIRLG
jgi:hypothetical protein